MNGALTFSHGNMNGSAHETGRSGDCFIPAVQGLKPGA